MATTEKVGILTHVDQSGNMTVLYPVTTIDAVDGIEEMRAEIENTCKAYADSKHMTAQITLAASKWSQTTPYTQSVSVSGLLSTDKPHYGVVYTENWAAEKEAFAFVDVLDTVDGAVIFTCIEEKPEADLTIQMEVNR